MSDNFPIHTVVSNNALVRGGPPGFTVDTTKRAIPKWTRVGVFECQHDQCHVAQLWTGPDLGWTAQSNLRVLYRDVPTTAAGPMEPDTPIVVDATWTPRKKAIANTYNRIGGLMQSLSRASGIDLAVALAAWYVESAGKEHVVNRAVIRFENHVLFNRWGSAHAALYDQHFIHGGRGATGGTCDTPFKCHKYRVADSGPFSASHTDPRHDPDWQNHEYEALELAQRIAGDVAYECASYGGAQIMGFNHQAIGYTTPREMYDAFQASERYHLFGFFDLCHGPLTDHIKAAQWEEFARGYNGPGDAAAYAEKIRNALADARAILPPATVVAHGLALSLGDVSVDLEFHVELVPQPDKTSCWAGSMAMLAGYKRGVSVDAEALAREVGRSLRTSYTWDMLEAVKRQIGLHQISLPSNLSFAPRPEEWHNWLRDFGPLWVTTIGAPSHAIVVDGIRGELTPEGAELHVLNPWDTRVRFDADPVDFNPVNRGYASWRTYRDLSSDFGNMGLGNYGQWRVLQIGRRAQTAAAHALDVNSQLTDWERADAEPPAARATEAAGGLSLGVLAEPLSPRALGERDVRWAADDVSPDYRHLGVSGVSQEFAFTGAHLDALCRANSFDLSDAGDVVLFGLRGCLIGGTDGTTSGTSVRLSENMPDHASNKCVIGVWKRTTGRLDVFTASTVPNWRLMESFRQGGERANMLSTGRYTYRVGTHRPGSAHAIPGAFLQQGSAVVVRTLDDLEYRVTDAWESSAVGDNIHAGRLDAARTGPFFSSAGCQTVPGNYESNAHRRRWADFRTAAGLSANNPAQENGRRFIYVLLTGREARLAAAGRAASLTRLRCGSRSTPVNGIQTALQHAGHYHGATTGEMDPATTIAFIAWQKAQDNNRADGIVTPALASQLGVTLTAQAAAPAIQSLSVPGVVGARRAEIESPLIAREHHVTGPNIILRWNAPPASRPKIDLLVHLHGFAPHSATNSSNALDFHRKETYSGLDFSGRTAAGAELYRERALLGIIPHGFRTGRVTGGGSVDVYDFPALLLPDVAAPGSTPRRDGLTDVIDFALRRFEHDLLEQPAGSLSRDRFILTAHSGGGSRLVALLARHDPHEVHLFDALYAPPSAAIAWVTRRIARDAAALATRSPSAWGAYMTEQGGALRAIFLASDGTTQHNTALHDGAECGLLAISNTSIRDFLRRYYRVEQGDPRVGHSDIPRRYGWQLLTNAAADLEPRPGTLAAPARCPTPVGTGTATAARTASIW